MRRPWPTRSCNLSIGLRLTFSRHPGWFCAKSCACRPLSSRKNRFSAIRPQAFCRPHDTRAPARSGCHARYTAPAGNRACAFGGGFRFGCQSLFEAGALQKTALQPSLTRPRPDPNFARVQLTPDQEGVATALADAVAQQDFGVHVLDGVTGSAKRKFISKRLRARLKPAGRRLFYCRKYR